MNLFHAITVLFVHQVQGGISHPAADSAKSPQKPVDEFIDDEAAPASLVEDDDRDLDQASNFRNAVPWKGIPTETVDVGVIMSSTSPRRHRRVRTKDGKRTSALVSQNGSKHRRLGHIDDDDLEHYCDDDATTFSLDSTITIENQDYFLHTIEAPPGILEVSFDNNSDESLESDHLRVWMYGRETDTDNPGNCNYFGYLRKDQQCRVENATPLTLGKCGVRFEFEVATSLTLEFDSIGVFNITNVFTGSPSGSPSSSSLPSVLPSVSPFGSPSVLPSVIPSTTPTVSPSETGSPTATNSPSRAPTTSPQPTPAAVVGTIRLSPETCVGITAANSAQAGFFFEEIVKRKVGNSDDVAVETTSVCGITVDQTRRQLRSSPNSSVTKTTTRTRALQTSDNTYQFRLPNSSVTDNTAILAALAQAVGTGAFAREVRILSTQAGFTLLQNVVVLQFTLENLPSAGTAVYALFPFYPDWKASYAHPQCLHDGNEPLYMINVNSFENSFYLTTNPGDCCRNWFSWAVGDCIENSDPSGAAVADVVMTPPEWYIDWKRMICVKDCPASSSDTACGGLKNPWGESYPSSDACCSQGLSWINATACLPS